MTYYHTKAVCPCCGTVKHFISPNEIKRMVCNDCQDKQPDSIPEMILTVVTEE